MWSEKASVALGTGPAWKYRSTGLMYLSILPPSPAPPPAFAPGQLQGRLDFPPAPPLTTFGDFHTSRGDLTHGPELPARLRCAADRALP